jgi:capsid assembly protease
MRESMRSMDAIRRYVSSTPWAMVPGYLEAMLEVLQLRLEGLRFTETEIADRLARASHGSLGDGALEAAFASMKQRGQRVSPSSGAIAVLPLYGVIAQKASMVNQTSGPSGTSTEEFGAAFDAAMNDPSVSAIVLDVDSPGGSINGVPELAAKIANARGSKRIVACATGMAASAAYWIASAADELAASPSADVGSIGVYTVHHDLSAALAQGGVKPTIIRAGKYKAEGHPAEPLSDDARADLQSRVDEAYNWFVGDVAKHRNTTPDAVRDGYGQGRVLSASRAKNAGMIDRVATLDEIVARLGSSKGGPKPGRSRAEAEARARRLALAERTTPIAGHVPGAR